MSGLARAQAPVDRILMFHILSEMVHVSGHTVTTEFARLSASPAYTVI
jgi:hypothetical protein